MRCRVSTSISTLLCRPSLLERTATHMQDPFSNRPTDTAMTAIARVIEINILQLIEETKVPDAYPDNKFYLM